MARKKTATDSSEPATDPSPSSSSGALTRPAPIPLILAPEGNAARDAVKVNNASANEMKIACDDAVKRVRASHCGLVATCAEATLQFLAQPGAFRSTSRVRVLTPCR